jgi:hypothetical protein
VFIEPSVLASEPVLGRGGARWHQPVGEDADNKGEQAFDQETNEMSEAFEFLIRFNLQILPSTPAVDTAHLQDASSKQ